ncbi:unnamed protein product [Spirodela intermedia]|uniref:ENTH domain-containing protein n=1 Tax=Spirodela intermedia TaxID=51605 RepID=A0A7I8LGA4_SPIIN|nr:unnamed protein product [Spirodela intermedia]
MQTWRKAYGALKDSTKIGLAKINSEFKDIDVAIVKATSHAERPPKERHVRKVFVATSEVRPRADVVYCIYKLARRLAKTHNWTVALKTLIVIHRTLREGGHTFREELLNYAHRGHVFHISNFTDDSSPLAWECSAWVRTYALFLEERLECLRILKFDVEAERLVKSQLGAAKSHSRMRELACDELLEQLPALQQLLFRLVGCQPEVAAFRNYLIQYALALVLKESFKIYCAINDGIINLVDMFFEMSKHDAIRAFNIYKRAGQQAESLSEFYEFCKGLELSRNFQFPTLRQPPPSFLTTMEEYIKEAPQIVSVSSRTMEYPGRNLLLTYRQRESPADKELAPVEGPEKKPQETEEPPEQTDDVAGRRPPSAATGDLLGLGEMNPVTAELAESNALALAVISPGGDGKPPTVAGGFDAGVSGWELTLVSAPTSNDSHFTETKLAGGFDKLLLDRLYDDAAARQQRSGGGYVTAVPAGPNPFAASYAFPPQANVQMALMGPHQHQHQQQMQTQMAGTTPTIAPQHHFAYQPQFSPPGMAAPTNPFGDPFFSFPRAAPPPPQGVPSLL